MLPSIPLRLTGYQKKTSKSKSCESNESSESEDDVDEVDELDKIDETEESDAGSGIGELDVIGRSEDPIECDDVDYDKIVRGRLVEVLEPLLSAADNILRRWPA